MPNLKNIFIFGIMNNKEANLGLDVKKVPVFKDFQTFLLRFKVA